jgi:hypothetical protein
MFMIMIYAHLTVPCYIDIIHLPVPIPHGRKTSIFSWNRPLIVREDGHTERLI